MVSHLFSIFFFQIWGIPLSILTIFCIVSLALIRTLWTSYIFHLNCLNWSTIWAPVPLLFFIRGLIMILLVVTIIRFDIFIPIIFRFTSLFGYLSTIRFLWILLLRILLFIVIDTIKWGGLLILPWGYILLVIDW